MFSLPSTSALIAMLLFSGIGFVAFSYGRKMERWPLVIGGVVLMVYPYFSNRAWLLWTLGAASGRVVGTGALRVALDIPARARDEALHTAVGRLRRLLRPHALDARLQTVHGAGYRWAEEAGDRAGAAD